MCTIKNNFNPRSHEESDPVVIYTSVRSKRFQSTLSRRERQLKELGLLSHLLFQSTLSRRERQAECSLIDVDTKISIHALTKRATSTKRVLTSLLLLFQSTLSRRERQRGIKKSTLYLLFQSTLSRRERRTTAWGI